MNEQQQSALRYGWASDFRVFVGTPTGIVRLALERFVPDASTQQIRAWDGSIGPLQHEVREVIAAEPVAANYAAILEYELPRESRRPDVVLLVSGAVMILECKGQPRATQADIDQASAYARDLRCYHRDCEETPVHAVLLGSLVIADVLWIEVQ